MRISFWKRIHSSTAIAFRLCRHESRQMTKTLQRVISRVSAGRILSISGDLRTAITAPVVESSREVRAGRSIRRARRSDGRRPPVSSPTPLPLAPPPSSAKASSQTCPCLIFASKKPGRFWVRWQPPGTIFPRASWSSSASPAPMARPPPASCCTAFSNMPLSEPAISARSQLTLALRPRRLACT